MKTFYSINGYWTRGNERIPESCGLYATRELAEEAFQKLTTLLDEQDYEYYLFITEVPLNETSDEVDTLINHFRYNMKRKRSEILIKALCAINS